MSLQQVVINTVVIFIVIYLLSRILGKKLISQMTFFDFVAGVSLGSIAGAAIFAPNLPIWKGAISLLIFSAITFTLDLTALKSMRGRKLINDRPSLIIKDGRILEREMRKSRLTLDDLLMLLRKKDIFYIDEIEFAIFETDGTISVLKKVSEQPITNGELHISAFSRGFPQAFIIDGKVLDDSLLSLGKDEMWVKQILLEHDILDVDEVSLAQIDQQMNVYISKKEKAFQ